MKILISEIENTDRKAQAIEFSQVYDEFNSQIPVKANLLVEIIGTFVKISGHIEAKLNLVCDICLKEFTKDLSVDVEEFYIKDSLNINNTNDFEIKEDNFVEDLNGSDEIDITDFVYQSVILNMPNKLVCDINCNGNENVNKYTKTEVIDPRLEIFKTIKIEKE